MRRWEGKDEGAKQEKVNAKLKEIQEVLRGEEISAVAAGAKKEA
ncbi:MAG: hypothetical protein P4M11_02705 [Candidatus Pacebacteria bacterium]|nr:hypothetical protein [Candidatus Paceibacterota bacterium]